MHIRGDYTGPLRMQHTHNSHGDHFIMPEPDAHGHDDDLYDAVVRWLEEHVGLVDNGWSVQPPMYGQGEFLPAEFTLKDPDKAFAFKMRFC